MDFHLYPVSAKIVMKKIQNVSFSKIKFLFQHVFYFDEIFDEACTNQDIYMKTTHPLIQHIFNGYDRNYFLLLPFIRTDEENIGKCWFSSPTLWNASVPEGKPKTKFSL